MTTDDKNKENMSKTHTFERLPKTIVPKHYDLELTPNLKEFTFDGKTIVKIKVSFFFVLFIKKKNILIQPLFYSHFGVFEFGDVYHFSIKPRIIREKDFRVIHRSQTKLSDKFNSKYGFFCGKFSSFCIRITD